MRKQFQLSEGMKFHATLDTSVKFEEDERTEWIVDLADQEQLGSPRIQVLPDGTILRDRTLRFDDEQDEG